ncbi:MAG TPA: hypothetical protein PLK28_13930 [Candidatus Rifleibacterium sp.]|nr:hypothetical protein [Candidatus Rifleibacterium sp.]
MDKNQRVDHLVKVARNIDDATARLDALFCVCIDSGEEVTKGHIATFLRMINEHLTEQSKALNQLAYEAKTQNQEQGGVVCG